MWEDSALPLLSTSIGSDFSVGWRTAPMVFDVCSGENRAQSGSDGLGIHEQHVTAFPSGVFRVDEIWKTELSEDRLPHDTKPVNPLFTNQFALASELSV